MASKLADVLRRYPVLLVALLIAVALVAACGAGGHPVGLWDGPI